MRMRGVAGMTALFFSLAIGIPGAHAEMNGWHKGRGHHDEMSPQERMDKFSKKLKLTAEQQQLVEAILQENRAKIEVVRAEARPKFEAIRQETRTQIRQVLTPEQQKTFDAMNATRDAEEQRRKARTKD